MNGADALVRTLVDSGVTACFANPGTSEMPVVAALDRERAMRPVLCLFEGVATGAADGYGRITGRPACTLLHLGPGYANGIANLHNARRARTPIVNIIGDHATHHRGEDAPLASDIAAMARPNSVWVGNADSAAAVARMTRGAIVASLGNPPGPASLILAADAAWGGVDPSGDVAAPRLASAPAPPPDIAGAVALLRSGRRPAVLLGGSACTEEVLKQAARLASAGVTIFCDTFVARAARGNGRFAPRRLPYFQDAASAVLREVDVLLLCGTKAPVPFFAQKDTPPAIFPQSGEIRALAAGADDTLVALSELASAIAGAEDGAGPSDCGGSGRPAPVTVLHAAAAAIARRLPENAVVCDDGGTCGGAVWAATVAARPHDWLGLTGGAIGAAMPLALGAGVAAPDRKVVALTGDGAAAYTVQALWTLARERIDAVIILFSNRRYRILDIELERSGLRGGAAAENLLGLADPSIDWPALAKALGVAAVGCTTADAFDEALAGALGERGPRLIVLEL